jgi:hypothetical protein
MNDYPKVATISPIGMPSVGLGSKSIFGSLSGLFGFSKRNMEASQFDTVMDAVSGRSLFRLGSPFQSELLEASRNSIAAPDKPRTFTIGMAYIDEKLPPEEAWGKKFNALPTVSQTGTHISYHDAVCQLLDTSNGMH